MVLDTFVSDSLRLKIDDKLVIIPSRKFEYLLVNLFLAITKQYFNYDHVAFWLNCINAKDIEEALVDFPEQMVPGFRKKRTYISAMLAKNERSGTNPYNNRILVRMSRGEYLLNPDMEMMVNDRWMNVYDLMDLEKPEILPEEEKERRIREDIRLRMAAWEEEQRQKQEELNWWEQHYGLDDDRDDDGEEYGKITGVGYDDTLDGQTPSGEQSGESGNTARKRKPRKRGPDDDTEIKIKQTGCCKSGIPVVCIFDEALTFTLLQIRF